MRSWLLGKDNNFPSSTIRSATDLCWGCVALAQQEFTTILSACKHICTLYGVRGAPARRILLLLASGQAGTFGKDCGAPARRSLTEGMNLLPTQNHCSHRIDSTPSTIQILPPAPPCSCTSCCLGLSGIHTRSYVPRCL